MDERPGGMERRQLIQVLVVGLTGGVAGCSGLMETDESPDSGEQAAPDTTATVTDLPAVAVEITTTAQPSRLPRIWDDHKISEFQARFSVETSGRPDRVTIANGRMELTRSSDQWTDDTVIVEPGQMTASEQEVTATATRGEQRSQDTAQVTKPTPDSYKLDIVPQRNEELRQAIAENADEEEYLQQRGGFITSDPTLDTYSSHDQLAFDKFGVDLVALEWYHDNDYEVMEEASPGESAAFIDIIGTDTGIETIEKFKSGEEAYAWYPATRDSRSDSGYWDYEAFANAETVGVALDYVQPLLFNWQFFRSEDGGPISSEDEAYAPMLEQAIEQKSNSDLEVHAWDVGLSSATHGNGLIYGKNVDGSETLRIMEPIRDPVTTERGTTEWHPLVENSGYLTPGNDGYERTHSYWHPLRFGWDGHEGNYLSFRFRKEQAAGALRSMASTANASKLLKIEGLEFNVAPTTQYISDVMENLRTFNQNNVDFDALYNQAKILHELLKNQDRDHVIYGDAENPQYAVVEEESVIDEVWEDQNGEYDEFDRFLGEDSVTT